MIISVIYDKNTQTFTRCQSDDDDPSIATALENSIEDDENFLKFKISMDTSALEAEFLQGNDLHGVDVE